MTPRIDIFSISVNLSLEEARRELLEAGHSRIPVVDSSPDDIVGILYARDLLECFSHDGQPRSLRSILREPFYVPETTTVDALLERMKRERLHMAIVLDEYGGVAGLVTLEDILEEIVGDIADEFDDVEAASVRHIDPHTIEVDARTHLDELNELFDLDLPEEADFDTVGGFVFNELGRIPQKGETVIWNSLKITITEVTERSVVKVNLTSEVPWPVAGASPAESSGLGESISSG
jgi:CBS domain containing-hemolysin-like protein